MNTYALNTYAMITCCESMNTYDFNTYAMNTSAGGVVGCRQGGGVIAGQGRCTGYFQLCMSRKLKGQHPPPSRDKPITGGCERPMYPGRHGRV
eukprot:350460-Chlamydomonas_euryale.AAC.2